MKIAIIVQTEEEEKKIKLRNQLLKVQQAFNSNSGNTKVNHTE